MSGMYFGEIKTGTCAQTLSYMLLNSLFPSVLVHGTEQARSCRGLDVIPGKLMGCSQGREESLTVLAFLWHSSPVILTFLPVVQASDDSNADDVMGVQRGVPDT